MAVVFVEVGVFGRDRRSLGLADEDIRALQRAILTAPAAAPVITGTGGLRKMRFVPPGRRIGKSGALRVCYAWFPARRMVLLVRVYAKTRQASLAAAERAEIARLLAGIGRSLGKRTGGRP